MYNNMWENAGSRVCPYFERNIASFHLVKKKTKKKTVQSAYHMGSIEYEEAESIIKEYPRKDHRDGKNLKKNQNSETSNQKITNQCRLNACAIVATPIFQVLKFKHGGINACNHLEKIYTRDLVLGLI